MRIEIPIPIFGLDLSSILIIAEVILIVGGIILFMYGLLSDEE